jgi:hypothetical protein
VLLSSVNPYECSGSTIQINSVTLPADGAYTMLVGDCSDTHAGNYNLESQCFGTCLLTAPVLISISPNAATAGGGGFTLTANGLNFVSGSVVQWNGSSLTTTYVSSTQLTAAVPASDLATGGSFPVTVVNPVALTGPSNAIDFAVGSGALTQTITFLPLSSQPLGTAPFPISVTASSGLSVTLTSQTTAVCTVSGSTVTLVATGTCTIQATQAGNASYLAATPVTQSFTVTPSATSSTVIFGTGYVAGGPGLAAIGTADGNFTLISCPTGAACVSNGNGGYYAYVTITGQYPFPNWIADTSTGQWIGPDAGGDEITADALGVYDYREAFDLTGFDIATVALTGSYTSDNTSYIQLNGVTVGPAGGASLSTFTSFSLTSGFVPGINTIDFFVTNTTGTGAQNPTGLIVELSGTGTLMGTQTITFGALANQVFGTAPFAVSATASSGLTVSFASTTSAVCTVSGATVTVITVGTCTIQAAQAGNTDYLAATSVNQSFQVTQAPQTVTFGTITNHAIFSAPFGISASSSSGLAVGFNSQTALVCSVFGTTVALISVGTCTIQATQAGNTDYLAATPVNQSFQVTQASQTITFGTLSSQQYGVTPFGVTATASSGLPVSFNSQTATVCTVSSPTVTLVSAGTCTIQATQAGDANYLAATPVSQSFQVAPAQQTIAFGTLPNQSLGTPPFTISAAASSGLAVTFTSQTATCTVSGNTVTLVSTGTCTVQATQAGNIDYLAATPVNQSFLVTQVATPTLTPSSVSVGPGAAFSIPITLALTGGLTVDSLTFGIQITPVGNAPALSGSLSYTNSSSVTATPFISTNATTNEISVAWASVTSPFSGTVTLGFVVGTLPAGTTSGASYTVVVTGVSAANQGGTNVVTVNPGANATLAVAVTYLVGDIAPSTSDTAPNFGDGILNILDLVQELFAVNNVPGFRPAACSDRYDAADTFPVDTATTRGGDGVLDIRDLVAELFRVNNLDTSRPTRASLGGCTTNTSNSASLTATARIVRPKRIARSEADGALTFGSPVPYGQNRERIPVYLEAQRELTGVALTFAVGDQQSPLVFVPAAVSPTMQNSQQPGVAAVAWLDGVSIRPAEPLLLGYIEGPAGTSSQLEVYGLSAVLLANNQEVHLASPDTMGSSR